MPALFRPCLVLVLAVAAILSGGPDGTFHPGAIVSAAWADDDGGDDGGDDDGGGGDDDGGDDDGGGRRDDGSDDRRGDRGRSDARSDRSEAGWRLWPLFGRREPAPSPVRRAPPARRPPAHAPEIVAADLREEDLAALTAQNFRLVETVGLAGLGTTLSRLAPPPGLGLIQARDLVRTLPGAPEADLNHFYRTDEGQAAATGADAAPAAARCAHANCAAHDLVGWLASCSADGPIGIVDTGVNTDHELLRGARIDLVPMGEPAGDPSRKVHGTAVVSVLAGAPGGRVQGLLPDTRLVVADIFSRSGSDERADLVALIRGLDEMDRRDVRLVNLSLSGPGNSVLERMVTRLVEDRGMILVAAAGNAGPEAEAGYPAAYDGVIAVTAVDRRGRIYRAAQRGRHLDMAAPGVGLMLATSISGAREKSGTSFATPFVTAAAAILLDRFPGLSPAELRDRLSTATRDLGAEGHDEVFGHGLLAAGQLCDAPILAPAAAAAP